MTHEIDARSAMNQAQMAVKRELGELHLAKRDLVATVEKLKIQLISMQQIAGTENDRKNAAYAIAETSIIIMYAALFASFIAIGYAVWVGW